ncbi:hypothetical protein ACFX43_25855 [Nocardioides sp. YIM B13467]|uniref:hypothetical protein n=1 Tax=Nocardioides sp. YIM B13467 TaxID=3366294 RepID=UPI003670DB07
MAKNADTPAMLNQDFRKWVKHWTGKGIGQVALSANISHSRAYAATAESNLVPRDLLLQIVRAAVPKSKSADDQDAWVRHWTKEWEQRWERIEASSRNEKHPLEPVEPVDTAGELVDTATESPLLPDTRHRPVARLPRAVAITALGPITDPIVREITAEHVYVAPEPIPVGYHNRSPISVYIDLHSASCLPEHREALSQFLAVRVRRTLADSNPDRAAIATPREGNLLIGSRVAEICGLPFLIVRTKRAPRFGFPVEGTFTEGTEAIIVDDLVMGTLTRYVAEILRHVGVTTRRCVSIFERTDSVAREQLDSIGVTLDSAYRIDDDLL